MRPASETVQTGPMWLLRSSSAKKINKPFDHKGPIHSLPHPSASLFLSLSLPLSPSPSTYPWSFFSSALLFRPLFFFFSSFKTSPCVSLPSVFIFLSYLQVCPPALTERQEQQRDRHHPTSREGGGGTDRRTDGQTDRHTDKGPLIPQTRSWCRAEEHNTENVFIPPSLAQKHERGLKRKLFPLRPLCAVTNALAASF